MRTRLGRLAAVMALFVTLAAGVAATARAGATTVSLDGVGDWGSPATVELSGAATCTGGTGTVAVGVRQGAATGTGRAAVVCDGHPRAFAVNVVGGPFQPGSAQATATLTAPSGSDSDSRTVTLR